MPIKMLPQNLDDADYEIKFDKNTRKISSIVNKKVDAEVMFNAIEISATVSYLLMGKT